jgi:hypothetical protein
MRKLTVLLGAAAVLFPATTWAGMVVGVGVGVSKDLGDAASTTNNTHLGVGPSLHIPVRYALGEHAYLRGTVRFDSALSGQDRLTWGQTIDGQDVRFYDDDHKAIMLGAGATIGLDADLTHGKGFTPYIGAEAGVAMINTYHSRLMNGILFKDEDVASNSVTSGYLDPFTSQPTFITDLHLGGMYPMTSSMALQLEAGYSLAYVDAHALSKTDEALGAMREAYGYNAIRLGVGVALAF